MQRKGNSIHSAEQIVNQVSVGIDMGGNLWATAVQDWETGKMSYYGMRDKDGQSKEARVFELVSNLVLSGKRVDAFYEAGRYGFWPARELIALGATVHILPVNKLKVLMSGKPIKTDKLDAKFLGGLHPSDHVPTVYIPTLKEEGRRDAERELDRLKESIARMNAQIIALQDRTPLPGSKLHRTASEWQKTVLRWSKLPEWEKCPKLLLLRFSNLIAELELYEKELASWEQIIRNFQDEDAKEFLANSESENRVGSNNEDAAAETLKKLWQFKGVGECIARRIAWEIGDLGRFGNGKQFASFFGLAPCPYSSGTMKRDQGISKSGRKSLRKIAVECAWLWYFWQKDSWLVKKWETKLAQKGRARRTAIIALARQLMVALWRYVVKGEAIEGAIINNPIAG